jgi:hypothetical protein
MKPQTTTAEPQQTTLPLGPAADPDEPAEPIDDGPITRLARATRCPRCGSATYTGLDGETCASVAIVDRQALTALGEALAQLAGLYTYERYIECGRRVLDFRCTEYIESRPAGSTPRNDVHPQHSCGRQWPPNARAPATLSATSRIVYPIDPPF